MYISVAVFACLFSACLAQSLSLVSLGLSVTDYPLSMPVLSADPSTQHAMSKAVVAADDRGRSVQRMTSAKRVEGVGSASTDAEDSDDDDFRSLATEVDSVTMDDEWTVAVVGRTGKPWQCKLCMQKSTATGEFVCEKVGQKDRYGGFLAWYRYKYDPKAKIKACKGKFCLICMATWRASRRLEYK